MAETATVDNLDIQVTASSEKASSALSELVDMMKDLSAKMSALTGGVKESTKATNDNVKATKKASNALKSLQGIVNKAASAIMKIPRAFGRIAFYRTVRSMIKAVTSAVTEGLTNLKAYSDVVGTAFSPAVDNLKRHILLLKNSIGSALRPVIEAVIPLIIQLADALSRAADFVAQVMSKLTGKVDDNGRYTKAVLSDLEQSNKQAKQLRRTLLGFDEINRLDAPTDSGQSQSSGLMFTQAEISPEAASFAEKLKVVLEKIAEVIKGIDWSVVLKVIGAILAAKAIIKIINGARAVLSIVKLIGGALGKVVAFLGGGGGIAALVAAIVVAFALWGDEISDWLGNAKKAVENFFDSLKGFSGIANAAADLLKHILGGVIEVVGTIASLVYHLVHGDIDAVGKDLQKLVKALLKLIVGIVLDAINLILGFVEDIANSVLLVARWVWNKALVPLINNAATTFKSAYVWIHNALIDIRIAISTVLKWILDRVNDALQWILGSINAAIASFNEVFGTDLKPIEFKIDTTFLDEKIAELEAKKLPPITETVKVVGEWKEPSKLKLQIDTTAALAAIDKIGEKVNKLGAAVSSVVSATGAQNTKTMNMVKYASGGFPSMGTVFVAGEAGAEYVTNINGRTGVYNTDQMANALYNAMVAALSTMPQQGGGDIYLDGEKIYTAVVRRNNNYVRSTGRTALLT